MRWVLTSSTGCSDCDDNALAGAVPIADGFPTGHAYPPAHSGCRCLVAPVTALDLDCSAADVRLAPVRTPKDLSTARPPRSRRRARWWIIGAVVVFIILLASLRTLASIYTDGLWFSSVGYHNVFSTLLVIKLGLFGVFGAIFFVVMWVNLVVCDRLASDDLGAVQKDELVRRYQQIVRPYAGRLYIALAIVMALIAASGTIGEWQNWILFRHGGNFGVKDPAVRQGRRLLRLQVAVLELRRRLDAGHPDRDAHRLDHLPLPQRRDPAAARHPAGAARRSRRIFRCSWR